jgi:predicted dehydrogenase
MNSPKRISRREFAAKSAWSTAGLGVASTFGMIAAPVQAKPSDTVGVGIIGVGGKGSDHLAELLRLPNAEIRAVCDVYATRLEKAVNAVRNRNPKVTAYKDYRKLLEDKNIDAVVIATPDHWHCQMTVEAAQAGKDMYVEKGMCCSVEEAGTMVKAIKSNKRVMQLGHQRSSDPVAWRAKEIFDSGTLGPVSYVSLTRFRNSLEGVWNYKIPSDAGPHNVDWPKFLGGAPKSPFSLERFFRWRKYWDYGTGISGDLLSHEWNAANMIMNLGIPKTCVASGGVFYWTDGREVPDVLNAIYEYPEKNLSVTFSCTFSNSRAGKERETHIFGRNARLELTRELRLFLEPYGERNLQLNQQARDRLPGAGEKTAVPVVRFSRSDAGPFSTHMENFIDCVRSRQRTRCNEDDGFEEAVTLVMSVIAYKERRMVTWDEQKKAIV